MKSRLVVIAILFFSTLSFGQANIDVIHYRFQITVSDKSDTIFGITVMTVRFVRPDSLFTFQLGNLNDKGQGMYLDGINNMAGFPLKSWERKKDDVVLRLPETRAANDTVVFVVTYHGIPKDGLIISRNKYGDKTFFADNWPNRAHEWLPCVDDPADKASFEFWVWTPPGFKTIANGFPVKDKVMPSGQLYSLWKEDIPLPTKVMVIGVSKFATKDYEDSPKGIPVSAWVYPQDSAQGFKNYSLAPSILKFYSDYIGPYPYYKLANVQSKTIFGGMENASAIFYFEGSAETKTSVEDLLAHEIAHQWFGDMATEKSFSHLWLSEGFATYLTDIYLEAKYGTDSMNRRLRDERRTVIAFAKQSDQPVVDSVSPLMQLLNANSYQKGAWVLHMLRRQMGDSTFHLFIRAYYDKFKGRNADTHDLELVAEQATGKDWSAFFKQWLYAGGIPRLKTKWNYDKKKKTVSLTVTQTQRQPAFQFPLEVALYFKDGTSSTETLNVKKPVQTFTLKAKTDLKALAIDPSTNLLFDSNG